LGIPLDKIDWKYLSKNPNAIHLIEQNMDKIIKKIYIIYRINILPFKGQNTK
jgi:hypothetical protein